MLLPVRYKGMRFTKHDFCKHDRANRYETSDICKSCKHCDKFELKERMHPIEEYVWKTKYGADNK